MQLLYNSDSFAVLRFGTTPSDEVGTAAQPDAATQASGSAPDQGAEQVPEQAAGQAAVMTATQTATQTAGPTPLPPVNAANPADGYEIVDKLARKEIYLRGAVAESFQRGVKALVEQGPDQDALEAYFATYTVLAQHPVLLH